MHCVHTDWRVMCTGCTLSQTWGSKPRFRGAEATRAFSPSVDSSVSSAARGRGLPQKAEGHRSGGCARVERKCASPFNDNNHARVTLAVPRSEQFESFDPPIVWEICKGGANSALRHVLGLEDLTSASMEESAFPMADLRAVHSATLGFVDSRSLSAATLRAMPNMKLTSSRAMATMTSVFGLPRHAYHLG